MWRSYVFPATVELLLLQPNIAPEAEAVLNQTPNVKLVRPTPCVTSTETVLVPLKLMDSEPLRAAGPAWSKVEFPLTSNGSVAVMVLSSFAGKQLSAL